MTPVGRLRTLGGRLQLRRRSGLIGLLTAETVSDLGNKLSFVAVPWFVLESTGSPTLMGVVAAAELVPFVLAGTLGAPLIDRMGCRRVSILTDIASALVMAGVVFTNRTGFLSLVALVAVFGVLRGIGQNAHKVLLGPEMETAGADVTRVTSLYYSLSRVNGLIGGPLAGVVISLWSVQTAIALDVFTFVLAAALITETVRERPGETDPQGAEGDAGTTGDGRAEGTSADADGAGAEPPAKESYLTSLREGFAHMWRDKLAFSLVAMLFVTNLCNQAAAVVLAPLWVKETFGSPAGLGLLGASFASGAIAGSIVFTALATKLPRYWTLVIGYLIGGAPRFLVLGLSDDLWVVLTVTFVAGVAMSSVNPIIGAVFYERTPKRMQSRVFGFTTSLAWAGMPIGGILGGFTAERLGFAPTTILTGLLYFGATLTPILGYRIWRSLDAKKPADAESDAGKPAAVEPAVADPTAAVADPAAEPVVPGPGTVEPVVPGPRTAEPGAVDRPAVEPAVTGSTAAPVADRDPADRPSGAREDLAVTLSYSAGRWSLATRRGAELLSEETDLSPADALHRLSLLDAPAARAVAEEMISAERALVEQRVRELRAELMLAEAGLARLRTATPLPPPLPRHLLNGHGSPAGEVPVDAANR